MRNYKQITYIASFLLVISISLFIMLLNIRLNIFNENLYKKEFSRHSVYGNLKGIDIEQINREVLEYLKGNSSLKTEFFSPREKLHLNDVKNLISAMNEIFLWIIPIIIIALVILSFYKNLFLKHVSLIFLISGITVLIISLSLILTINFNFHSSFDKFHRIFFSENTWLFNPAHEKIVVLYPTGLFYDIGKRIFIYNIVSSLILLGIGLFVKNHPSEMGGMRYVV